MAENEELQSLVLGILAPAEEAEERKELLTEICESHIPAQIVLSLSREALQILNEKEDLTLPVVSELAAKINRTHVGSNYHRGSYPGYTLALLLLDYLQERVSFDDLLSWIKKYADELELKTLTQNNDQRMAYLEKQWGDQTSAQLAEILKTKKPTVQRWIDGGNPSSSNAARMDQIITVLFRLHTRVGMSEDDALDWFNSHNAKLGASPRNLIRDSSYWGITPELRQELLSIGAFD